MISSKVNILLPPVLSKTKLSSLDVLRSVFPDYQDERVTVKPTGDDGWFNMRSAVGMIFKLPGLN